MQGQEIVSSDIDLWSENAALADDRVLAELLRMPGSGMAKAILPFTFARGLIGPGDIAHTSANAVVAPGTGAVYVAPFRAIIGSRTGSNVDALKWWRDIRSGIFVGNGADAPTSRVALTDNTSGNPRWDLVYAAVAIDLPDATVVRKVKNPTTSIVAMQSIPKYLATTVTIGVVTGTPGASPNKPSLPADAGSTYNIPIAYVRVADGFNSGVALTSSDVYDVSPAIAVSSATGASVLRPASGVCSQVGSRETNQPWPISGDRPGAYLPPTMQGGEARVIPIDLSSGTPSAQSGDVIDDSIDWTRRFFGWRATASASSTTKFASDPSAASVALPYGGGSLTASGIGQSFIDDHAASSLPSGAALVAKLTNAELPALGAGVTVALYVDRTAGTGGPLKLYVNGTTPTDLRVFFWVEATAPFGNA